MSGPARFKNTGMSGVQAFQSWKFAMHPGRSDQIPPPSWLMSDSSIWHHARTASGWALTKASSSALSARGRRIVRRPALSAAETDRRGIQAGVGGRPGAGEERMIPKRKLAQDRGVGSRGILASDRRSVKEKEEAGDARGAAH